MKLNNKVAVITGGNSGIGLTTAQTFIQEGATVIIIGRNQQALDEAVRSLARTLSAELVGRGVRVNTISPGPIQTPLFGKTGLPQEAAEGLGAVLIDSVPMKRLGKPEEIAKAVLFLASDDSSYVLGADFAIDGGQTQL
jgi:NAD(P)-dependent dehydrogenase (short-subunit alcohol dehydrogenase family)